MSSNKDNGFSYEGAEMLFDYLEGLEILEEDEMGIEFDSVALRCEYSEYNTEDFIIEYCQDEFDEYEGDDFFLDHIEDTDHFITGTAEKFIISN